MALKPAKDHSDFEKCGAVLGQLQPLSYPYLLALFPIFWNFA